MSQPPILPPPVKRETPRPGAPSKVSQRSGISVVEEATNLLRGLSARAWLLFYASSIPFVLGVVFFWSEMSRAADAGQRLVPQALLLALLYVVMKCGHAAFGDLLLSRLRCDEQPPARLSLRQWLRLAASQGLIHATMPWMLAFASVPVLPFAWAYAFYRNTSLFACGHQRANGSLTALLGRSLKAAHHAPRANHSVLVILFLVALLVWLNTMMLSLFLPQLTGIFTGIQLQMTSSPMAMLNTTLVATSVAASWLIMSPVFQAAYAVRCFEADSTKSGEDLLAGLRSLRLSSSVVAVLFAVLSMLVIAQPAAAQSTVVTSERSVQLDQALDETLEQAEFRWRLPREAIPESEMGWIERTMNDFTRWLSQTMGALIRWIGDFLEWLFDQKEEPASQDKGGGWFSQPGNVRVLLIILIVVLVAALVVLIVRWFAARQPAPAKVEAVPVVIDLSDESVIATDLPEDEWLKLAEERLAAGDSRLALRAFFLGTLSRLGKLGLLAIEPGKTNGMYLRELYRRPRATGVLRAAFDQSVRLFEFCWYGNHAPDADTITKARTHHDTICQDARPDSN